MQELFQGMEGYEASKMGSKIRQGGGGGGGGEGS